MSRERVAWLVSVVLLAVLAFQLPGTFAQRDDEYAWVRTIVEIQWGIVVIRWGIVEIGGEIVHAL